MFKKKNKSKPDTTIPNAPKNKSNSFFNQMNQSFIKSFSFMVGHFGMFLFILLRFFKRNLFFGLLCCMVVSLLYQYSYVTTSTNAGNFDNKIPEKKVAFILIKENRYGANKTSFNSLTEHLKTWGFNEEKERIDVKFESMLPSEDSKVVVIYDRGFDSFERYSDLFFVRSFPYEYYFKNQPLISVKGVSSDGSVDLVYNGKRISLDPEQSYPEYDVSNFQFIHTEITNFGFFNHDQFHLMKKDKKEEKNN